MARLVDANLNPLKGTIVDARLRPIGSSFGESAAAFVGNEAKESDPETLSGVFQGESQALNVIAPAPRPRSNPVIG